MDDCNMLMLGANGCKESKRKCVFVITIICVMF